MTTLTALTVNEVEVLRFVGNYCVANKWNNLPYSRVPNSYVGIVEELIKRKYLNKVNLRTKYNTLFTVLFLTYKGKEYLGIDTSADDYNCRYTGRDNKEQLMLNVFCFVLVNHTCRLKEIYVGIDGNHEVINSYLNKWINRGYMKYENELFSITTEGKKNYLAFLRK